MTPPMQQLAGDFKIKSFWQKPEGKLGAVVAGLLIIAAGLGLYAALPALIIMAQNTLHLAALCAAIGAIGYVVFDTRPRTLVFYAYKSIMRAITGAFVELDPLGILNGYIDDAKKKIEKMATQIANLSGQMRTLQNEIDTNARQITNDLKIAGEAQTKGKQSVLFLKARSAGRLKDSNMTLTSLHDRMEVLYRVLNRMHETSETLVEDMAETVRVKTKERKMVFAGYSAMRAAREIISGQDDKRDVFNQAMEFLTEDYGQKVGEIEDFLHVSEKFMDSVDLQNGIYEEDALTLLNQWEKKSDSILMPGGEKHRLIAQAYDPSQVLDLNAPKQLAQPVVADTSLKRFLD